MNRLTRRIGRGAEKRLRRLFRRYPGVANKVGQMTHEALKLEHRFDLERVAKVIGGAEVVIDVGAHRGLFSRAAFQVLQPRVLLAVEPNRSLHETLRANCPEAQIMPFALGAVSGSRPFFVHRDSSMSSLLDVSQEFDQNCHWESSADVARETVEVRTLSSVLSDLSTSSTNIFLKLDAQGAELEILRSGGPGLRRCSGIQLEFMFWNGYEGKPRLSEIVKWMAEQGYEVGMVASVANRSDGTPATADFLFLRSGSSLYTAGMGSSLRREQ